MGYLYIDHRNGQGLDGQDGKLEEFDTVPCGHCGGVIAVLVRAKEHLYLSNVDIAHASMQGAHLGHEYQGKRPCRKCKKPLCRACHARNVCLPLELQVRKG